MVIIPRNILFSCRSFLFPPILLLKPTRLTCGCFLIIHFVLKTILQKLLHPIIAYSTTYHHHHPYHLSSLCSSLSSNLFMQFDIITYLITAYPIILHLAEYHHQSPLLKLKVFSALSTSNVSSSQSMNYHLHHLNLLFTSAFT